MAKTVQTGLVRSIGRLDLVAVTINSVIGAGIFGLPARVFGLIGDFSLLAFVVCAVFASLIVICFAEVGSRFTETGGPYLSGNLRAPSVGLCGNAEPRPRPAGRLPGAAEREPVGLGCAGRHQFRH